MSHPGYLERSNSGGTQLLEADFSEAPRKTRFVVALRSRITPYDEMASAFPARGQIVDLACGWGLLSLALCRGSKDRRVVGIDHDAERVRYATRAAERLPAACRPVFALGDAARYLETVPAGSVDGIAMIDSLHYFDDVMQRSIVSSAARALRPDGVLVARDIDAGDGIRGALNKMYERLATGVGFTKAGNAALTFRDRREWTQLFEAAGFSVRSQHSGPPFLADVMFTGLKTP